MPKLRRPRSFRPIVEEVLTAILLVISWKLALDRLENWALPALAATLPHRWALGAQAVAIVLAIATWLLFLKAINPYLDNAHRLVALRLAAGINAGAAGFVGGKWLVNTLFQEDAFLHWVGIITLILLLTVLGIALLFAIITLIADKAEWHLPHPSS